MLPHADPITVFRGPTSIGREQEGRRQEGNERSGRGE